MELLNDKEGVSEMEDVVWYEMLSTVSYLVLQIGCWPPVGFLSELLIEPREMTCFSSPGRGRSRL